MRDFSLWTIIRTSLYAAASSFLFGYSDAFLLRNGHYEHLTVAPLAHNYRFFGSSVLRSATSSKAKANDDDGDDHVIISEEDKVDVRNVSDEEMLLACRAYLQKKNRLKPRTAAERKQDIAKWQKKLDEGDLNVGFFWEDVNQLKCYARPYSNIVEEEEEPEEEDEESNEWDDPEHRQSVLEELQTIGLGPNVQFKSIDDESSTEDEYGEPDLFKLYTDRSTARKNYSAARRKMWAKKGFRERWYKKRYPNGAKDPAEKRIEEKMKLMPPDVLNSPELLSMTEDEIDEAVRMYKTSNKKRSKARKKLVAESDDDGVFDRNFYTDNPHIDEDHEGTFAKTSDLFDLDGKKEKRAKRGQLAKQFYQKRIENQQGRGGTSLNRAAPPANLTQSRNPIDALTRVTEALDYRLLPSAEDVRLMMEPKRLATRKAVLRRILAEHFDARGKCIPPLTRKSGNDDDINQELVFVTMAPVNAVGAYAINLIEQRQKEQRELEPRQVNSADESELLRRSQEQYGQEQFSNSNSTDTATRIEAHEMLYFLWFQHRF